MTLAELRASILVQGPRDRIKYLSWDASWRLWLVEHLEMMVNQLWTVGVSEIYIDGSSVEDKDHPNDIDGYFVCDLTEFASGRLVIGSSNSIASHALVAYASRVHEPRQFRRASQASNR